MSLGSNVSSIQQCTAPVSKISRKVKKVKNWNNLTKLQNFQKNYKFPPNFSKFYQISPKITKVQKEFINNPKILQNFQKT